MYPSVLSKEFPRLIKIHCINNVTTTKRIPSAFVSSIYEGIPISEHYIELPNHDSGYAWRLISLDRIKRAIVMSKGFRQRAAIKMGQIT